MLAQANSLRRTDPSLVALRKRMMLAYLREQNLDGLLLSRIENVRYLTGFRPVISGWFGDSYLSILTHKGEVALMLTDADRARAAMTMPWVDHAIAIQSTRRISIIAKELEDLLGSSVAIGYDAMAYDSMLHLKHLMPRSEFRSVGDGLSLLRSKKLPQEIRVMERGAKITQRAVEFALENAQEGVRECALSGLAEAEARALGADGVSWSFATFSGTHAGMMFRHDTTKRMKLGEFLILGYATIYNGYNTDITVTTVVGERPTPQQKKLYQAVLVAYDRALSMARPGVTTASISRRAAETLRNRGIKDGRSFATFQPLIHGLGMNVYEPPFSPDPGFDEPNHKLSRGNVLAIEPAIAHFDRPELGGIRVGETVVVEARGPRVLGGIPRRSREIFAE